MKIQSLYFKNGKLGWEVKRIEFQNLNLLVGLSGAGKSQIIRALWYLRGIALGTPMDNVEWSIQFLIEEDQYEWKGVFMSSDYDNNYRIKTESLRTTNGFYIERRNDGIIYFIDEKGEEGSTSKSITPEGLLFQIYTSPDIKLAVEHFKMMNLRGHTQSQTDAYTDFYNLRHRYASISRRLNAHLNLDELQKSNYNIAERLLIASKKQTNGLTVFRDILEEVQAIFPTIEDWKVEEQSEVNTEGGHIEYKIKIKGQTRYIPHMHIASGMLRTFNLIADFYLSSSETVFLLDEFENSLGHNCLPHLEELIMERSLDSQFIITSHHPDIINKIPKQNWLIIERENGSINNNRINHLGFSKSFHEPYLILTNHFDR